MASVQRQVQALLPSLCLSFAFFYARAFCWGCTVFVDNSVSYGTTHNGFYTKNVHANNSYPYGILRHKIQDNKKYGVTYRAFQAPNTVQIEHQS